MVGVTFLQVQYGDLESGVLRRLVLKVRAELVDEPDRLQVAGLLLLDEGGLLLYHDARVYRSSSSSRRLVGGNGFAVSWIGTLARLRAKVVDAALVTCPRGDPVPANHHDSAR